MLLRSNLSKILIFILAVKSLAIVSNHVQADDALLQKGYDHYLASTDEGSSKDTKKAIQIFEAVLEQDPSNAFATVMLGASYALKGRDALMPWKKMKFAENGMELMSKAQNMIDEDDYNSTFEHLPVYIQVKSQAGIVFSSVPKMFNRLEDGRNLLEEVVSDPILNTVPPQSITHIFFYAAVAAEKDGDFPRAKELYGKVTELDNTENEFVVIAQQKLSNI